MSVCGNDIEKIIARFHDAEDETRNADPTFHGGFHAIAMQALRLENTLGHLKLHQRSVNDKCEKLSKDLRSWRARNPTQKVRGLGRDYRRSLRSRQRLGLEARDATFHQSAAKKELDRESNQGKVEFEQRDYGLRVKIEGLEILDELLAECRQALELRLKACKTLEKIGNKLWNGEYKIRYGEKLAMAYAEVVDGTMELKEINKAMGALPDGL